VPTRTQLHAGNSKKIDAKVVMTEEHSVESLFYLSTGTEVDL
jgi:hypothetical protein